MPGSAPAWPPSCFAQGPVNQRPGAVQHVRPLMHVSVERDGGVLWPSASWTPDKKYGKERVHFDIETDDVEAEVQRLEALGATRWDHQQERGYDFWVLRDPWGNEFCVLQPEFPHLLDRRSAWSETGSSVAH